MNSEKRKSVIKEVVITIAVIVILAAVLIPPLVIYLNRSRLTADERAIKSMNSALEASATVPADKDGVLDILREAGFNTPVEPTEDMRRFYWIAGENVVVLVETEADGTPKSVLYPKKYAGQHVGDGWYWLGEGAEQGTEEACTHDYPPKYYPLALPEGGSAYHTAVCSNCDEVLAEEEVHTFGEDGVCLQCGYEFAGLPRPNFTAEQLAQSAVWVYKPASFAIANAHTDRATVVYFSEIPDEIYASLEDVFATDSYTSDTFATADDKFAGACIKLNKDTAVKPATYRHGIVAEECGRPVGVSFTLDLNGHELRADGKQTCTVFYIYGEEEVNIFDSSAAGTGKIKGYNPNVSIDSPHVNTDYSYGLIYVGGGAALNLYSGTLETGRAMQGGGIHAYMGTVRIYGGRITGCSAYQGGGVYLSVAHLEMYGGKIDANKAYALGAGVCGYNNFHSDMTMSGGTIENNEAFGPEGCGGGVYLNDATGFAMTGGEIVRNKATRGAGLYLTGNSGNTSFAMSGGKVSENAATEYGGAFYLGGSQSRTFTFNLSGGTVDGNSASLGGNAFYLTYATLKTLNGAPEIAQTDIYDAGTESAARS